jgi:hypothetical protein
MWDESFFLYSRKYKKRTLTGPDEPAILSAIPTAGVQSLMSALLPFHNFEYFIVLLHTNIEYWPAIKHQ